MFRKIIQIDEEKCTGCGLCAEACRESAIAIVDGKARLLRDDYCDGLGNCLPVCPSGAISFVEREAAPFDESAVQEAQSAPRADAELPSRLRNWPVQLKLAPVSAPCYAGADLLVAADCTAYAYGGFHENLLRGRVALIGCPKLDGVDYTDKLRALLEQNAVRSVTVARMQVPCCGGLERAVRQAVLACGRPLSCRTVTVSTDGRLLD